MNGPTIEQVAAAVSAVMGRQTESSSTAPNPVFSGRLLGLRQAEHIGQSVNEIFTEAGTVITPLARDLLKKRGIAVRIVTGNEAGITGEWGLAVENQTGTTVAVTRSLLEGSNSWTEIGRTTADAATWVTSRPNRGAAILTGEASVACWRANGLNGIRAAVACEAETVSRAIRSMGVNLLVIGTDGKSIPWIRHLLATFRRGGVPTIPLGLERGSLARVEGDEDRRGDRTGHSVSRPLGPAERALRDRLAHAALGSGGRFIGPR